MIPRRTGPLATLAFASVLAVGSYAPASAQGAGAAGAAAIAAAAQQTSGVTEVQYRRHWGPRYHRHGYYGHRYRRGWGGGAVLGGLAAGAIIGGAIASQNRAYANDAVAYCMNRYRSYDPRSGTYLGYDGLRHPCP